MKVVVDTNVIVSAYLSRTGGPAQILEAWRDGVYDLLVSEVILREYRRVLGYEQIRLRHGKSESEIFETVEGFRRFGVLVEPASSLEVIEEDPADNRFLECAVAGESAYIVSGDAHLLRLREYQGIPIISPAVFLAILEQDREQRGT